MTKETTRGNRSRGKAIKKAWRRHLVEIESEVNDPKLIAPARRPVSTRNWMHRAERALKRS